MKSNPKICTCIIVGGGIGSRFSSHESKLQMHLFGKPVYCSAIENFISIANIQEIILVGPFSESEVRKFLTIPQVFHIVPAGSTRVQSVWHGLEVSSTSSKYILIHDAARPYVPKEMVEKMMGEMKDTIAGILPTIPIYDALKRVVDDTVQQSIPRAQIQRAQTPQLFHRNMLMRAYQALILNQGEAGDDVEVVMQYDREAIIKRIEGSLYAEKITDQNSYERMKRMTPKTRKVGFGWDFHPFQEDRPLILGGCEIEHEVGLEGDSDGDVVSHALVDALLGALGKGDIGAFFGIKTPSVMHMKSLSFLDRLRKTNFSFSWVVENIDVTIICRTPLLSPYIQAMKRNLADVLQISIGQVNIKATTDKGMDAAGEGKGIRAVAVSNIIVQEAVYV